MPRRAELTGTSYALLGLLAARTDGWSAYELAQQMGRSLRYVWPRAERNLYDDVKLLAERGLARTKQEPTGRRPRTVYSITSKGRRALREWLSRASAPLTMESEALVRVFFADHGTLDDLRRTIRGVREEAEATERAVAEMVRGYESDGGPFPERLHVIALMGKLLHAHREALRHWADWAEAEVASWADVTREGGARIPEEVFEEIIATAERLPEPAP
ncbi:MAG TPA: PadR family transcriptional regulator [Acidimicrobiales bacterium]|nr:PadR family transcriptional regulator [Acidimicrobiales bacterium]